MITSWQSIRLRKNDLRILKICSLKGSGHFEKEVFIVAYVMCILNISVALAYGVLYRAFNIQSVHSFWRNKDGAVGCRFLFYTNRALGYYSLSVTFLTETDVFPLSEDNKTKLYLGSMEYALNNDRLKINSSGSCKKSSKLPSTVVDELYNSISMNRRDVYFLVPLKNGGSFKHVLTDEEAYDYQEALRRWFKATYGDEYNQ